MSHVLQIDASSTLTASQSRAAGAVIVEGLGAQKVTHRDLAETPLPQITEDWVNARLVPAEKRTPEESEVLALSDQLIEELKAADTIVIGMPLYNFGMPAALKAWIDLIARPRVTFQYTEGGPVGLLEGKKAIVVFASGGVPMGAPVDFATPHLTQVLNFVGITDVEVRVASDVVAARAA